MLKSVNDELTYNSRLESLKSVMFVVIWCTYCLVQFLSLFGRISVLLFMMHFENDARARVDVCLSIVAGWLHLSV